MTLAFHDLDYQQAYYSLFTSLGKDAHDSGLDISPKEYPNGYTRFAFDLKGGVGTEYLNLVDKANIRVEAILLVQL